MKSLHISVIICCYNSAERIEPTLEHLSKQSIDKNISWEVILVDNKSTDNIKEISKEIWNKTGSEVELIIVEELHSGLANARNKGIQSARGEILIFCDDDNWLDEEYLQIAYDIMKDDSSLGMLGGIGEEIIEGDKPFWFDRIKSSYAIGPQSDKDGDITFRKGYVYGAGAVIRKSVLKGIYSKGFVNQLTDRVGKTLVSGGDNEIGYMIAFSGFKIYYSSKLKFKHFVPQSRLTVDYVSKLVKGQQLTKYKVSYYESYLFEKSYVFPRHRFENIHVSMKKILKLCYAFFTNNISFFDFKVGLTRLFYDKFFLIIYYDKFKRELDFVKKNILIYK